MLLVLLACSAVYFFSSPGGNLLRRTIFSCRGLVVVAVLGAALLAHPHMKGGASAGAGAAIVGASFVALPIFYVADLGYTLWRYQGSIWAHFALPLEAVCAYFVWALTAVTLGGGL
jgi:hypothetical protein